MSTTTHDVLAIGNAIFDILGHVEEDFLVAENLAKGSMSLVDADRIHTLYDKIGPVVRISGGSAGNTIAGVADLGGKAAFIGKVADDEFGEAYGHDMRSVGVTYGTPPLKESVPTASCLVLVTPDGERTMNTFLGASQHLTAADIDAELVRGAGITFLEGYLFDPPEAKEAFRAAAGIAQRAGRTVALTLSDTFCVERNREDFTALFAANAVDVLFANEHEMRALYQTSDLDAAVREIQKVVPMTVVTMGSQGAMIVTRDEIHQTHAQHVEEVVDLTGAGDLFAGGFMFGMTRGLPLPECARIGAIAAAEVISHIGARPQHSLKDLVRQEGVAI